MPLHRKALFLVCVVFGLGCFATGLFASGLDLSPLAVWVSQTGKVSAPLLEKLRLLPAMFVLTGAELLLLSLTFGRRGEQVFAGVRLRNMQSTSLMLLLVLSSTVSLLSLNFEAVHLAYRLRQRAGKSQAENAAVSFGDEYGVIKAVREQTPESAAIFVRTARPLQFLLAYELYPRQFYSYPQRSYPPEGIPDSWFVKHRIQWILEISDSNPMQFSLRPRQEGSR